MSSKSDNAISNRFSYIITFLLGFAFCITLVKSAWDAAIERKQRDFNFEILTIQQDVTRNILTGNDITNNVAAYVLSNEKVTLEQFNAFSGDIIERFDHVEAINIYTSTSDDWVNEFPLLMKFNRPDIKNFYVGEDIYVNPKYRDAIDTAIETSAVVPAPPELDSDIERKYWLFKAVYLKKDSEAIKSKKYKGIVTAIVSVLISPTRLLGDKGKNSNLTITMFSDTSNLYGRQLLYFSDPNEQKGDSIWKVDTLSSEKLIQLPPYSIKIIIEKGLYFSELEYHLVLIAMLIGLGILLLLYGLSSARAKQQEELELRNKLIEQKVEEQTEELAIARDEALEAVKLKSEFLASMSHEIRTPLNAIIGMSDLMTETNLTKEQNRYVSTFRKAGDALLSLVNDILDLSKIEANQLVLEKIPFNISELIEEATEIYALKAADKGIEIIPFIESGINPYRLGDPGRLKQIILNLISNALKFTEEGEIVVKLTHDEQENDYKSLQIVVSDTGIGIAKDKLESIFASFTQADASTTRKYGGTGLGLTISKHLTEMMNGRIDVESEENKGSKFYIHIKLEEQEATSDLENHYQGKQIVIADNRESSCLSLSETLSGANCTTVNDISALRQILSENYDVLILDSQLYTDEVDYQTQLEEYIKPDRTLLSVNPKDIQKHSAFAKKKHIKHVLIKPFKRKELIQFVNTVLKPGQSETIQNNTENIVQEGSVEAKSILLVEDNPDNRMLVKAYLKKTPHKLDEAENGQVAVDMFKQNDYDLVFMDVQMPVMDGHEATRLIRAWEKEQNKKQAMIIALTAHAIKEEIDKCLAAGCDRHLGKPIKKTTLLESINEPQK